MYGTIQQGTNLLRVRLTGQGRSSQPSHAYFISRQTVRVTTTSGGSRAAWLSSLHNERVGADSLAIDSVIEEQRNGGYMWKWDRFSNQLKPADLKSRNNPAIGKQASAAPTVVTKPWPDSRPSAMTETTDWVDLGASAIFKGHLSASEDVTLKGRLEGTIEVRGHTLTVAPGAQIEAQILVGVATIRGTVHGNVTATKKVEILATGSLDGDIVAPQIAMAEGASFRGKVDLRPGNAEQVLASQSAPARPRRPAASGSAARPSASPSLHGPQESGRAPD